MRPGPRRSDPSSAAWLLQLTADLADSRCVAAIAGLRRFPGDRCRRRAFGPTSRPGTGQSAQPDYPIDPAPRVVAGGFAKLPAEESVWATGATPGNSRTGAAARTISLPLPGTLGWK